MKQINYGYKKQVNLDYEKSIEKVKELLKNEGFGILTEIDVKETLKKKLDVDVDKYIILGACNPPFALKALKAEKDIGLMLPCNVIIYESEEKVFVNAINPVVAMGMIENSELKEIAEIISEKLKGVIEKI